MNNKWQEAFNYAHKHYNGKVSEYWACQLALDYAEYIVYGIKRNR